MMRRMGAVCGLALVAAAGGAGAAPAAAQVVTLGADVANFSHYVWRGLNYGNKFSIQPDAWLSVSGLTVGVWANIAPSKCTDPNDICETGFGGTATRSGIAEIDAWTEYARTTGNVSWKLGWILYTFNKNNLYFNNAYDTHEFYGQFSVGGLPVTPTLAAWYDVDKVNGGYIQPSISYGVKASPSVTINLTALAGFSAGQGPSPDDFTFNFSKSGLTHVDFSAATSIAAGPISFAPALHFQINGDQLTRISGALPENQGKDVKFWGGVTLSWSRALNPAPEKKE